MSSQILTLAQIKQGTGFDRDAKFVQVPTPAQRKLPRVEQDLFDLAQMRLSQIWERNQEDVPDWGLILEVVAALNAALDDFQLGPESRHRVATALDRMYEPSRESVAAHLSKIG